MDWQRNIRDMLYALVLVGLHAACGLAQEPGIRPRAVGQAPPNQPPRNAAPPQPRVPFQLAPQEQQRIDQMLDMWERESDKVKSFKCKFTRWDYDTTFGPKANDYLMAERYGEIKFRAPDNGTFKETSMKRYDPATGKYADTPTAMEHWVCDGKAIYQFRPEVKTLEITELPPEMRGKAITEGPLPFIFGAKAEALRQKYWIREITPPEAAKTQIWLEAWPKHAAQAANYQRVEVILSLPQLLPFGMQIYTPNGKDRTAYVFGDEKNPPIVNDPLGFVKGDFLPPMTPFGWKKVVNPVNPPAAQAPPQNRVDQARRPTGGLR